MPIRDHDPFANRAEQLDPRVNPYVALLAEAVRDGTLPILHGPALKEARGEWLPRIAKFHGRDAPFTRLVVEVGCHKGLTLTEMAKDQPDTAFVGVDITFKRVVTTAQRARELGLKNVFCVLANAASLDQIFAPCEVDGVVLFFPDPWVKKQSQAKNRLVNPAFAARLKTVLKGGGFFWFKSDQEPYLAQTTEHIEREGFVRADMVGKLFPRDYLSTFERRFAAQKLPTHGGAWRLCYH
jgi:tRNA (guanine-N7-)-methyltransferase